SALLSGMYKAPSDALRTVADVARDVQAIAHAVTTLQAEFASFQSRTPKPAPATGHALEARLGRVEESLRAALDENQRLRAEVTALREGAGGQLHGASHGAVDEAQSPGPALSTPAATATPPVAHHTPSRSRYPLSYAAAAISATPRPFPSTFESAVRMLRDPSASPDDRLRALRKPLRNPSNGHYTPAKFVAVAARPGLSVAARTTPIHSLRELFRLSGCPPVAYIKPIGKYATLFECWVDDRHMTEFQTACCKAEIAIEADWEPWRPKESSLGGAADVEIAHKQYLARMTQILTSLTHPVGRALRESMLTSVPANLRTRLDEMLKKRSPSIPTTNTPAASTARFSPPPPPPKTAVPPALDPPASTSATASAAEHVPPPVSGPSSGSSSRTASGSGASASSTTKVGWGAKHTVVVDSMDDSEYSDDDSLANQPDMTEA
ncbi:hypothetical protein HK405_009587, partial [Cladochytrium tenue]